MWIKRPFEHLAQFDASKMRLGARALRKRLHLRSWCHQMQNRIWSGESTHLKCPTKSGPWKVRETTVRNPWNGREKPVKSHQKLAPNFYSCVGVCCSLFTGFSLKSLEPLVISSSLGTYRLEIGWRAAVVAKAVGCMWGLVAFPIYMSTYIPRFPQINKNTMGFRWSLGNGRLLV